MAQAALSYVTPSGACFNESSWFKHSSVGDSKHVASAMTADAFRKELNEQIIRYFVDYGRRHAADLAGPARPQITTPGVTTRPPPSINSDGTVNGVPILRKINVCVDDERFKQIQTCGVSPGFTTPQRADAAKRAHAPNPAMLTFHGTSSPETANSIVEYGYLAPGEQHPRHGYPLNMRVGNLFGDGIYSSSDHCVACGFAGCDGASQLQLIVNVVIPGKVGQAVQTTQRLGKYNRVTGGKTVLQNRAPGGHPVFNVREQTYSTCSCCDGFHRETDRDDEDFVNTLTPDFGGMWITATASQIIPVAVIDLGIQDAWTSADTDMLVASCRALNVIPTLTKAERRVAIKKGLDSELDLIKREITNGTLRDDNAVVMTHLASDLYALPATLFKQLVTDTAIHRMFVVPRSLLFDRSFVTALAAHLKSIGATAARRKEEIPPVVIVYGAASRPPAVIHARNFESTYSKEQVREKAPADLAAGMGKALDLICNGATWRDYSNRVYHGAMVFVDAPNTACDEAAVDALIGSHGNAAASCYTNVKFAFAKGYGGVEAAGKSKQILRLKHFQQEGIHEAAFVDTCPGAKKQHSSGAPPQPSVAWPTVLTQFEEEFTNIGRSSTMSYIGDFNTTGALRDDTAISVYDYDRVFGEGFVARVDQQPVHEATCHNALIYKGFPPKHLVVNGAARPVRVITMPLLRRLFEQAEVEVQKLQTLADATATRGAELEQVAMKGGRSAKHDVPRYDEPWWKIRGELRELSALSAFSADLMRNLRSGVDSIRVMLARFRNALMVSSEQLTKHKPSVEAFANGLLTLSRSEDLFDINESRRIASDVAQVTTELATIANTKFTGEWFLAFQQMKHGRALLKRQQADWAAQTTAAGAAALPDPDVLLARLAHFAMPVVPLRLAHSSAAEVEPWAMIVEYVSVPDAVHPEASKSAALEQFTFTPGSDLRQANKLLRSAELRERRVDRANEVITDGLFLPSRLPPGLNGRAPWFANLHLKLRQALRYYHAYIFTRNPCLVLGAQMNALVTVAWVRTVESLLHRTRPVPAGQLARATNKLHGTVAPLPDCAAFAFELAAAVADKLGATHAAANGAQPPPAPVTAAAADDDDEGAMGARQSTDLDDYDMSAARATTSFDLLDNDDDDDFDVVTSPHSDGSSWVDAASTADADAAATAAVVPDAVQRAEVLAAPSLCRVLGRMLLLAHVGRARRLQQQQQVAASVVPATVQFDLLAESIVRLVHSFARARRRTNDELHRWVLGVNMTDVLGPRETSTDQLRDVIRAHQDAETGQALVTAIELYDLHQSAKRTGKLLSTGSFNNCSPFAVVSTLGFLAAYADGADAPTVLRMFERRDISMGHFLAQCVPSDAALGSWDPVVTQAALFLFAVQTHSGGIRRPAFSEVVRTTAATPTATADGGGKKPSPAFASPLHYVADSILQLLKGFVRRREASEATLLRQETRFAARSARTEELKYKCRQHHGVPALFTVGEVKELNLRQRRQLRGEEESAYHSDDDDADDQEEIVLPFERMANGLLVNHCCFPDCPDFLKCVATRNDLRARHLGQPHRRHGMRKHLQANLLANRYCPGFHNIVRTAARAAQRTAFEHFKAAVEKTLKHNSYYKRLELKEEALQAAWKFHSAELEAEHAAKLAAAEKAR